MTGCPRYFTDQNGAQGNEFWRFSNTKWMLQAVRVEKSGRKISGHLPSFYVSFQSYGP